MGIDDLKPLYKHPDLLVAPCDLGHGVFAGAPIPAETTLEECHHLRLGKDECNGLIDDYVFGLEPYEDQPEDEEYYSLPLGWGSIYNHCENSNTAYWHDQERDLIIFYTTREIAAGEQLFINYGRDWWESRDLEPS